MQYKLVLSPTNTSSNETLQVDWFDHDQFDQ